LFNLFASTQNNLRQTVRQVIYTSGSRRYCEGFVHNTKLGTSTAVVDFNAGVVSLPLVSEALIQPDSITSVWLARARRATERQTCCWTA